MVKVLIADIGDGIKISVRVYSNRRQYLAQCRSKNVTEFGVASGKGTAAKFIGYHLKNFTPNEELIIGECLFYEDYFDADCVPHELYHALTWVSEELGKDISYKANDHEWFAYTLGVLTKKAIDWYAEVKDGPHQRRTEVWSSVVNGHS